MRLGRRIPIIEAIESAGESIFFMKLTQVFLKITVVVVEEVEAAGRRHPGGGADKNCVCHLYLFQQMKRIIGLLIQKHR